MPVVIRKAVITAVVVGSILLLINQYDALFGPHPINWIKAGLTYCVPFCVYLYGAHSNSKGSDQA